MSEELKIIISAEINKLKEKMEEAETKVKSFKEKVKENSAQVKEKLANMSTGAQKALGGFVKGIAAGGAALLGMAAATTEYRESQAKLQTAFEQAGGSAEQAAGAYNDLYRVLGDGGQATEAATHLAKLTTGQKELEQWTTICQGVYSEFGASLPIESLTEAANETAKTGSVTGALADALNWAGVSEEDFQAKLEACNDEAEREKLIRETLNGLYAGSAAEYEKNNAQVLAQRDAQAKLTEALAAVGEAVAPIMTMLTELGATILAQLTPYIQQFAETHLPKIKEALSGVGEKIGQVISWIAEHWELVSTIAAIIAGIVTALAAYNAVMAVVAVVTNAATLPILAIIAALAAVVAVVVLVVKHWDEIKAATQKAFQAMKEAVSNAIDSIVGFFKKVINFVKENWQGLLLLIVNPFAGAFKLAYDNCEGFRKKVNDIFTKIKSTISEKINAAKDAIGGAITKIKNFFNFKITWPKVPMPKFSISPSGWKIGDLLKGSIPKLSISWNALGGVFEKPTVFGYGGSLQGIGEAGAEAVVPLEKNTKWMNILAEKLGELIQVDTVPIVLKVDGKTFAQTAISTINQLTQQTGTLALNIL